MSTFFWLVLDSSFDITSWCRPLHTSEIFQRNLRESDGAVGSSGSDAQGMESWQLSFGE